MDAGLFQRFRELAHQQAGIELRDGKETLVSARVAKRLRALGLPSEEAYLDYLEKDTSGEELVQFLDVISTNFTSFYRERDHFALVEELVSKWLAAGKTRFRFWCAASSSGEEPYTLAITLAEVFGRRTVDWRILATDISTRVLTAAMAGSYSAQQVEPVPPALRERWFDPDGERWVVRDELKRRVAFRRLNLAQPPYPMSGPLDIVLCRNVMIYFDKPVRQRLVGEFERLLAPGSYLLTGHSETLNGLSTVLEMVKPSVYRMPERG